jgi:hypothetical protein
MMRGEAEFYGAEAESAMKEAPSGLRPAAAARPTF